MSTEISKEANEKQFNDFINSGAIKTNMPSAEDDQKDLNEQSEVDKQISNVNNAEDSDAPSSHTEERSASVNEASNNGTNAGDQGGDTDSQNNQSQSSHVNTDSIHEVHSQGGTGPESSRGSTKATGEYNESDYYFPHQNEYRNIRLRNRGEDQEDEKEEDGSPILTLRYIKELMAKEWRNYYRTPHLNEKLYLHYKGFSYFKNMEIFTDLKCLYFEGNGTKSLLGLEHNTMLRSLFVQENLIKKIEGLDNLKDLTILNLNDNLLESVHGIDKLPKLSTFYAKRNKFGRFKVKKDDGEEVIDCVAALKGLLDCPSITCLDISDNFIDDPAIVDEILVKMPNLGVLYSQGNDFQKKISSYRKMIIARIPTLKFVDDRPVFPEDRRRAEAYARGGIEEERKEMKLIKEEKEAKHWANHDAFLLMVNKAKEEKKAAEEAKGEKTKSMKEMMAAARAQKELSKKKKEAGEQGMIIGTKEDCKEIPVFTEEMKELAIQQEKNIKEGNRGEVPELTRTAEQQLEADKLVDQYNAEYMKQATGMAETSTKVKKRVIEENKGPEIEEVVDEEEDAPPLETVDIDQINTDKELQRQEFLNKQIADSRKAEFEKEAKKQHAKAMLETGQGLMSMNQGEWKEQQDQANDEDIMAKLEDQKLMYEVQAKITEEKINKMMNQQADALIQNNTGSNFEELD